MGTVNRRWKWGAAIVVVIAAMFGWLYLDENDAILRDATRFAEAQLRREARDPAYIVVRNVRIVRHPGEPHRICGEVNARNGYGGYGGFRPFYVVAFRDGIDVAVAGQTATLVDIAHQCDRPDQRRPS